MLVFYSCKFLRIFNRNIVFSYKSIKTCSRWDNRIAKTQQCKKCADWFDKKKIDCLKKNYENSSDISKSWLMINNKYFKCTKSNAFATICSIFALLCKRSKNVFHIYLQ